MKMDRLVLPLLLVCLLLSACAGREDAAPAASDTSTTQVSPAGTPDEALETYINALRQGDREAVRRVMMDDTEEVVLHGPIVIDTFEVTLRETLDAQTAALAGFTPPPQAGDVHLDVRQVEADGPRMYSYWLRPVDGRWKIYARSAWNADGPGDAM